MSCSWVDPHFAALYARREEERLAERLVTRMRERAALEPTPDCIHGREPWCGERHELVGDRHLSLL